MSATASRPSAATAAHLEVGRLDATAQAALVASNEVKPAELVAWAIERVESLNPRINAVVTPAFDAARAAAATAASGPFAGVPMLCKDLVLEIPGMRFTEGSRFLRGHVSTEHSELAVRYQRAGLIVLGKTNTPEFGIGPSCEPLLFGPTRNPWNPVCSTSGSSGGSAAAVAAGLVPVAHGSDLGGSIRYPASACGVFGLKPTRARNPLGPIYGDIIGGMACEHVLTRTVRDSAALLDATAGPAPGDPYPAPAPQRRFATEAGMDPGRLRIAFSRRTAEGPPAHPDCLAALDETLQLLESLGHDVIEAGDCGITEEVGAAVGAIINVAMSWIVASWVRRVGREPRAGELEPASRALREAGQHVGAAEYLQAVEVLQRFARRFAAFLDEVDIWLTPTMSAPPPQIGEMVGTEADPLRGLVRGGETIRYAGVIANITGNPAMSVPLVRTPAGMPIGMHFLAPFGDEATLFRLAGQLEAARPWAGRWPPVSIAA